MHLEPAEKYKKSNQKSYKARTWLLDLGFRQAIPHEVHILLYNSLRPFQKVFHNDRIHFHPDGFFVDHLHLFVAEFLYRYLHFLLFDLFNCDMFHFAAASDENAMILWQT